METDKRPAVSRAEWRGGKWVRGEKGHKLILRDEKKMPKCPKLNSGGPDVKLTRDGTGGSCSQLTADVTSRGRAGAPDQAPGGRPRSSRRQTPPRPGVTGTFRTAAPSPSKTLRVSLTDCELSSLICDQVDSQTVWFCCSKQQPLDVYFLNLNLLGWLTVVNKIV